MQANFAALMACSIPSHSVIPLGVQIMRIWAQVHRMASSPRARPVLMTLWHLQEVVRTHGWWHSFLASAQFLGASLLPGGFVRFGSLAQEVSVDISKVAWMHLLRRAWRVKLMTMAHSAQPGIFPNDPECLDWDVQGIMLSRFPRLATIYARGVNTKDRARRHFGLQISTQCEHGCPEPDSVCHRVISCVALEPLRRAQGIDGPRTHFMTQQPIHTQECCLWSIPEPARTWCRADSVHNLLIGPRLLRSILEAISLTSDSPDDAYSLRVRYAHKKYGEHPLLSAHAVDICVDGAPSLTLSAWGPVKACTRRCWEAQIVLIAALLHQGSGKHVQIHGLLTPIIAIAQDFNLGAAPSAYMRSNVQEAMPCLFQEPFEKDCDHSPSLQASLDALVQPAVGPLSFLWKEALAWSPIYANSFDYYPQAHTLSRSHGNSLGATTVNLESVVHEDTAPLPSFHDDLYHDYDRRRLSGGGSSSCAFGAVDSLVNWPITCPASSPGPC